MANKDGENSKAVCKDVEGYIHEVSSVKTPASGHRYFDFVVQERHDSRRVVCSSPEKRENVKKKESGKTPVRLLNVSPQKRRFHPYGTEYKMGVKSKVVETTNIAFAWAESEAKKPKLVFDKTFGI